MKKLVVAALAFCVVGSAMADGYRHHHHHGNRGLEIGGAVILGTIIGSQVARASQPQPEIIYQPPVYTQPQVIIQHPPVIATTPRAVVPLFMKKVEYDQNCQCYTVEYVQVGQ